MSYLHDAGVACCDDHGALPRRADLRQGGSYNKLAVLTWEKGMAIKHACAHPDCNDEGIFAIEDGEDFCMQHIHERIPWLPKTPRRRRLVRPTYLRQDGGA